MEPNAIALMEQLLTCGTEIPLWQYDGEGNLLHTNSEYPVLDKILDFIGGIRYMLRYGQKNKNPLILGSDMGLMWCAVFQKEKEQLKAVYLLGPVLNGEVSPLVMEESVQRYHIDPTFRSQYLKILRRTSVVPGLMFLQYGLMLHYCVTGEKLTRSDIQFQPRSELLSPVVGEARDSGDRMDSYYAQSRLLQILREGDRNYTQAVAESRYLFHISQGPLPQALVRSAGFAALCIREAIAAGISPDTAYAVGEGYVENMIQCRSAAELSSINLAMFEDFVYRTYRHRTNPRVSPQIHSCREYIELHAEQELKLPELAKHVGYSEYYLSRKFKKEMGVSITAYIKYVRVERSKLLLMSTGLPVAQIAASLHFASSSHFSEAFREVTGKTPQQYRTQSGRL